MELLNINTALNLILAYNPAFPILLENMGDGEDGTFYLQSFLPVEPDNIEIAFDSPQQLGGMWQVLIQCKIDTGNADIKAGVTDLSSKFYRGLTVEYGGQKAEITKAYSGQGFMNGVWYNVPFTVEFNGFT